MSGRAIDWLPRCRCGRLVSITGLHGWFRHGEHGSEEGWVCSRCVETWAPTDGRGRGPEAGYCGVVHEPTFATRILGTTSALIDPAGGGNG